MAIAILLVALALADAPGADAHAGTPGDVPVEIDEKLVRYDIKGDTTSELISQMAELGPYDEAEGRRFDGYTQWSVRWTYQLSTQRGGHCSLGDLRIDLEVRMTLPEWQPKRHADRLLVQGWPRYLEKLTEHEMGHRDNGVRAAFAVRDAIAAIAPMADCGRLESAADAAGNAAIARLRGADVEYDRETAHGARQGVALP
jgi:predicted secreted Zn-dependent protease